MTSHKNTEAQSGVGTLIIFIAIILVAAMVASVVINSNIMMSKDVESKARSAGEEIGTSLSITSASGHTSSNTGMDGIYAVIKPASGSAPIDLDTLVLQLTLAGNTTKYLTYNQTSSFEDGHYSVSEWIRTRRDFNSSNPIIEEGDLVEVYVAITSSENRLKLPPNAEIVMLFMPENGIPKQLKLRTPTLYPADSYVVLYP